MKPRPHRFEDLEAWRLARALAAEVYAVTEEAAFGRDWALREAARRAVLRVMEAAAELALPGAPVLVEHRVLAVRAALAGLRSLFYVALDQGYVDQEGMDRLRMGAAEVARRLVRTERQEAA